MPLLPAGVVGVLSHVVVDRAVVEKRKSDNDSLDMALTGGDPRHVGWFRHYFADQRWEWSPQVEQMHGYRPGTVTPTTALVLSHKHPDDLQQVAATVENSRLTRQPFSTRHRIIDTFGREHNVLVVGIALHDEAGQVVGTHGFYVDMTVAVEDREKLLSAAIAEIAESRAVIEQVKGMLMLVYRIDETAAFELLRWRSQEANVKLRALAARLAVEFVALADGDEPPDRSAFDHVLLTAHTRTGPF